MSTNPALEPPVPGPPSPADLLDAGTDITSLRVSDRYSSYSDHELEQLAGNMLFEKKRLQHYIEKGRLQEHWQGIVADAKESVRRAQEAEMERLRLEEERRKKELAAQKADGGGDASMIG